LKPNPWSRSPSAASTAMMFVALAVFCRLQTVPIPTTGSSTSRTPAAS
jgi:hypothetical protein